MRRLVVKLGLVIAGVLLAAVTFGASPAMATATNCNGLGFECTNVTGTGLHITSMWGQLNLTNQCCDGPYLIHIELTGPQGFIKNCPQYTGYDQSGVGPKCTWAPNKNEPAGNYYSIAWQKSGAQYFVFDEAFVGVHS
jgi:hypothetical protein